MTDWVPDPRPVPDALRSEFRPEPYRDPFATPVLEQMSKASLHDLSRILGGWPVG